MLTLVWSELLNLFIMEKYDSSGVKKARKLLFLVSEFFSKKKKKKITWRIHSNEKWSFLLIQNAIWFLVCNVNFSCLKLCTVSCLKMKGQTSALSCSDTILFIPDYHSPSFITTSLLSTDFLLRILIFL